MWVCGLVFFICLGFFLTSLVLTVKIKRMIFFFLSLFSSSAWYFQSYVLRSFNVRRSPSELPSHICFLNS